MSVVIGNVTATSIKLLHNRKEMVLRVSFEYMLIYFVHVISFSSSSHEHLLLLDTEEIILSNDWGSVTQL